LADGRFSGKFSVGAGRRERFAIVAPDKITANARAERMRELAALLVRSGRDASASAALAELAASPCTADFEAGAAAIVEVCDEAPRPADRRKPCPTFREFADDWTDGTLHRRHPDHVKKKFDAKNDVSRLVVLNKTIGHVRLADFTLDDYERAMAALPVTCKTGSTRRQYSQIICYLIGKACYPFRHIDSNPIPDGARPKASKPPEFPFVYPSEDLKLMRCGAVDFDFRAFTGFCVREGVRESEATALTWRHFDLEHPLGVVTTNLTKTGETRTWPLCAGTRDALLALRALRPEAADTDLVFLNLGRADDLAEKLRTSLQLAGVQRAELYDNAEGREMLRFHDLRASFITIALANNRTEAWITDRTGHTTSQMLYRYKRKARRAVELELGDWTPLDEALGFKPQQEIEQDSPPRASGHPISLANTEGGGRETGRKLSALPVRPPDSVEVTGTYDCGSKGTRTLDLRIKSVGSGIERSPDSINPATSCTGSGASEHGGPRGSCEMAAPDPPETSALASLRAAAHAAVEAGNWTLLRALEPLIDAETKRVASHAVLSLADARERRDREG
jgi:integrase